jgi:hypothetical protein
VVASCIRRPQRLDARLRKTLEVYQTLSLCLFGNFDDD